MSTYSIVITIVASVLALILLIKFGQDKISYVFEVVGGYFNLVMSVFKTIPKKLKRAISSCFCISPVKRYLIWDSWRRSCKNETPINKLLVYLGIKSNPKCHFTSINCNRVRKVDWINIAFENLGYEKIIENREFVKYFKTDIVKGLYHIILIQKGENNIVESYEGSYSSYQISVGMNDEETRLISLKMKKIAKHQKHIKRK